MRNKIFGLIGVVWGLAIIANWIMTAAKGSEAYQMGQLLSVVFGVVLAVAGGYAIFKPKRNTLDENA